MHKHHPDIKLKWCEHSLDPHGYCDCNIEHRGNIEVDIVKMIFEHHSNRTW